MAVVARETSEALDRVLAFLGVDACNRSLFGRAAERCGRDSFSAFIEALDAAIRADPRHGAQVRIKERIAQEKALKESGGWGPRKGSADGSKGQGGARC